jgi:hypothetical protein
MCSVLRAVLALAGYQKILIAAVSMFTIKPTSGHLPV